MSCQWPHKHRHPNKAAAEAHIGALWRDGKGSPDMSAYACGDHWHVGHDAKKFAARVKRSLVFGRNRNTTYARNRRRKR